jgi:hypothetical protein
MAAVGLQALRGLCSLGQEVDVSSQLQRWSVLDGLEGGRGPVATGASAGRWVLPLQPVALLALWEFHWGDKALSFFTMIALAHHLQRPQLLSMLVIRVICQVVHDAKLRTSEL